MRDHATPESQAALAALVVASIAAKHGDHNIMEDIFAHLLVNGLVTRDENMRMWCEEQSEEHNCLDLFAGSLCIRVNVDGTIEEFAV